MQAWPILGGGQFEWLLPDGSSHCATSQALHANANSLVAAIGFGNADSLQIRTELPTRDSGDLGTDTTEVLRFTASLDTISDLRLLSADFTFSGHRNLYFNVV